MSNSNTDNPENRARAVMSEIEHAFDDILEAANQSSVAVGDLVKLSSGSDLPSGLIDKIQDANTRIVAACSSQDVIRQHLGTLIAQIADPDTNSESGSNDEKLLAGPRIDGQGLNQQDIDDMFD